MQKTCQNCKQIFEMEPEDQAFYTKINVPPPTFCPDCRLQRRLMFRNERTLYKRTCDLCKKSTLSVYSEDKRFTVYCPECWQSDKWDPFQYGKDLDFQKPFLEQFKELLEKVPRSSVYQRKTVNTPYANYVDNARNVYLSYSAVEECEYIFYSKNIDQSHWIFDSLDCGSSEKCYENIMGEKNYECIYTSYSRNCINCSFVYDCVNCKNCFLCTNLRNKEYCIRNEDYTKSEYEEKIKELSFGSFERRRKIEKEWQELQEKAIRKYANIVNCIEVVGDDIRDSKNAKYVFNGYGFENVKYAFRSFHTKDSLDIINCARNELMYEFISAGATESSNVKFVTNGSSGLRNVEYSDHVAQCSNVFGCIGLRSKQFCILNKQYEEKEFYDLRTKIIKHMSDLPYIDKMGRIYKYGEFFPAELSPFAYNETIAQEYITLSEEEGNSKGFNWKKEGKREHKVTKEPKDLPDNVRDTQDSITNEIIECEHKGECSDQCASAFRIIPQELEYYKKVNIALPRLCPNCRHYRRLKFRNPLKLWHRSCMCDKSNHDHKEKCPNEFETSYNPDRPETIYCESCYQKEII